MILVQSRPRTRIGILGYGSIGRVVAQRLRDGAIAGVELTAIADTADVVAAPAAQVGLDELIRCSDVIVECASPTTVIEHGERIVSDGTDLVISSAGALADRTFAERLRKSGPGRAVVTSGAIGGLDVLAAAADAAPFDEVTLTTTKQPVALVQPWMDAARAAQIRDTAAPLVVFEGGVEKAVELFPRSLNVAAAVAYAVSSGRSAGSAPAQDEVQVRLIADPAAELTRHEITATGPIGRYRFVIENLPSADNPRTSAVVPHAVLRTLATLLGSGATENHSHNMEGR